MRQQNFADDALERYCKPSRRGILFGEMNKIVPWCELCETIELCQFPAPRSGADGSVTSNQSRRSAGNPC